jgi:hypothetical protein
MEVTNDPTSSTIDPSVIEEGASKIKQKLGAARRRVKQIDLRQLVIDNPFPAVGIGLALGVAAGLARPMPKQSRVAGVLGTIATAFIMRTVREMAMTQFGQYARSYFAERFKSDDEQRARDVNVSPPF